MKLSHLVFEQLSSHSTLNSLVLRFPDDMAGWLGMAEGLPRIAHIEPSLALARQRHFGGILTCLQKLQNIKRLTLLEIWGPLDQWAMSLLNVLRQSPGLRQLALSISEQAKDWATRNDSTDTPLAESNYFQFFSKICIRYGETEDRRLQLSSLRLAKNIGFPELHHLRRLTETAYLKDLHFYYMYENTLGLFLG